ncbi:hypothetical protein OESDEN_25298 [Oesophagostomum dentatum]|uniref:Uncharacterized protein n=1 Tax=Oesophagostomum dentatum TaxID=61180 RepID=A0A0B1RTX3_OESDE|nr:hypothetical protein OESDEN_25298 [Oesophagostomum dentatum]
MKGMQRIGFPLSLMYGICMRALMEYGLEFNVMIPWLIIFLGPRIPGLVST